MKTTDRQSIRINQLLHGYDEGHRLLAGSVKPEGYSAKTLLALSDLSGQGLDSSSDGYITGYPLSEMNKYALSKTWLATEMPRPGCVWTHTLLIDFSDLAVINRYMISELFRRPSIDEDVLAYNKALTADTGMMAAPVPVPFSHLGFMIAVIEALYGSPSDSIFVPTQSNFNLEEVVLALWLQQWPRLMRNFRFCTWASSDRSRPGERFDLQVVPQNKSFRDNRRRENKDHWVDIKILTSNELASVFEPWARSCALDAISENRESAFQKFLWRYGAEVESGRAAFKPLALIWQAFHDQSKVDVDTAVAVMNNFTPPIESLTQFVAQAVTQFCNEVGSISQAVIEFIVRNIALIDEETIESHSDVIAASVWQSFPEHIWPLFRSESVAGRTIAYSAAKLMKPEDALSGADGDADLFCSILKANLSIATSRLIWEAPAPIPRCAASIIADKGEPSKEILYAMIESDNSDIPEIGIDVFGPAAVTAAVECYDGSGETQINAPRWILSAKKRPELLLAAIGKGVVRRIETLEYIASLVGYRAASGARNRDEWAYALDALQDGGNTGTLHFHTFLLARALSGTSSEPEKLIRFSFDMVHNALVYSRMGSATWRVLKQELPEVSWWLDWDKAYRLRLGVVKFSVDAGLSPKGFLQITHDDNIFEKMVDLAVSSPGGLTYLVRVLFWSKDSNDNQVIARRKMLESAMKLNIDWTEKKE